MGKDGGVGACGFSLISPEELLLSPSSELIMHSRLQDGGLAFEAGVTLLSDFEADSNDSARAVCVLVESVSRSLAFSCGAEVVVEFSELVVFVSAEVVCSFLSWFSALLLLSDDVLSFFLNRFRLRR